MTRVNEKEVKVYAISVLSRTDGNPLEAIGALTMRIEAHKRGECNCGNTVEFLQEVINQIVDATYEMGEEQ